jgi:hypothetical protein
MGDLAPEQSQALEQFGAFIGTLDTTEMVKSYKMLVLLAMIDADRFLGSISIDELATHVERLATRTARVQEDVGSALSRRSALIRLLEQNPIAAWTAGRGTLRWCGDCRKRCRNGCARSCSWTADGRGALVSPRPSRAPLPGARMPAEMRDGDHGRALGLENEEHAKRKPPENGPADVPKDDWKANGPFFYPQERGAKFAQELVGKPSSVTVVPRRRFKGIKFCLRPNDQTRHLPTGAQALLDTFDDVLPRTSLVGSVVMRLEPLLQKRLLPLL